MLIKVLHRIAANSWIFDRLQRLFGREETLRRLEPLLLRTGGQVVLDVGAGTGSVARIIPPTATYIALDNDWQKHTGFKSKWPAALAIQCDATNICLHNKSVDYAVCIAITHHLNDEQLPMLLRELARVVRRELIFLDAVKVQHARISDLLWKYDRGAYPRSAQTLETMLKQYFDIDEIEQYTIQHSYLLCSAKPKDTIQA